MRRVDLLLVHACQLMTFSGSLRSQDTTLEDGAVAVDHGEIVAVGGTENIRGRFEGNETIDATGCLVTPGLIDCHTHLIFAGSRDRELDMRLAGASYMDILKSGGGILKTVHETRSASKDRLVETGRRRLDRMMLHGTTAVEVKSGYGLTVDDEVKILLAARDLAAQHPVDIAPTFMGAHAIPPEYIDAPDRYVELVTNQMIPRVAREGLAEFCDVFCDEGVFSVEQARRILAAGVKHGLAPKIHADEFSNIGASKLAIELKAISAEHMLHSSRDDLVEIGRANVLPVFLPAASLTLMTNRFADANTMLRNNWPFALASDFNPSCPTVSLQLALTLACYGMRIPIVEALRAMTLHAAKAIKRDHVLGSIEPGKKADLVVFDVSDYRFLLQHLGANLVSKVVKNGRIVVDAGRIVEP